jgi:hypothetical protein
MAELELRPGATFDADNFTRFLDAQLQREKFLALDTAEAVQRWV